MDEFTEEEVEQVDQAMEMHMRHHVNSNSVLAWTCSDRCRREALGLAINKVIKQREPVR